METDEFAPAVDTSEESNRARRRHLTQHAITLAVQARWMEAVEANQQILELTPDDGEACNRLGKAYTELGRIAEAREAYENTLRVDAANLIAQRNLERLSRISESEAAELAKKAGRKLDPQFFTEETGKTGVTSLQDPAPTDVLATLTAGDEVGLESADGQLRVVGLDGTYVGRVEDALAARLTRLIEAGNQYRSGVVGADEGSVRVIIRETLQSPQNVGRISFPPKGEGLPRPYVREGLLRRSSDEEDDELEAEISDVDADDEEEDSSEFGFHEGPLDEQ